MPQFFSLIFTLALLSCGRADHRSSSLELGPLPGTSVPEIEVEKKHLKIFASLTKWAGSSGKEVMVLDAGCTLDAQSLGLSGLYKAMVTTEKRGACKSADCNHKGRLENLDWVLAPQMEYRLPDGETIVGFTNELALLDFPLTNPLSSATQKLWTGFADYWTSPYYSFESCAQLSNQKETGFVGLASAVSADLLKVPALTSCEEKLSVICVEQDSL